MSNLTAVASGIRALSPAQALEVAHIAQLAALNLSKDANAAQLAGGSVLTSSQLGGVLDSNSKLSLAASGLSGPIFLANNIINSYYRNVGNNARVNAVIPSQSIAFGGNPSANTVGYVLSGISTSGYTLTNTIQGVVNGPPAQGGATLTRPFRLYGAMPYDASGNGMQCVAGWNIPGNAKIQSPSARFIFTTDEPKPILTCGGSAAAYVMNINDGSGWKRVYDSSIATNAIVTFQAFTGTVGGGVNNIQLDFTQVGGRKRRDIEIIMFADTLIKSVGITSASTYYDPPASPRLLMVGDSLEGTVAGGIMKDAYPQIIQDTMGIRDIWLSSEGGTGFVATNSGIARTHLQKLQNLINFPQLTTIDLGYIQCSVNDNSFSAVSITAAAVATFNYALTNWPGIFWIIAGPTAQNTLSSQANSIINENAVKAAIAQINSPYILFIPTMTDPSGQAVTGTGNANSPVSDGNCDILFGNADTYHFIAEGHRVWGADRIAPCIVNALYNVCINSDY